MRKFVVVAPLVGGTLALAALASAPLGFAIAHEAHNAQCTETAINATNADIQAMNDGEAKTKAIEEMQMAEEMMAKKDMEGCATHMHSAMEAIEK
jgi:hypothetical protein